MGRESLAKQLHSLLHNIHSFTDGQVQMLECDWDSMSFVKLEIAPSDGLYKGGRFLFKVDIPIQYPVHSPTVSSLTPIFHPNIENDERGSNVCLSLFYDWTPRNTLEDVVMGLLFLLYNPNIDDPLSTIASGLESEEFRSMQLHVLKKQASGVFNEKNIKVDDLYKAQNRNDELLDVEWDVLGEAAKAEWLYQLEQEQWQDKIAQAEKSEADIIYRRNKDTFLQHIENEKEFTDEVIDLRTNHAFGKVSLQRHSTVTAPEQQADLLKYIAPNKDTLTAWKIEPANENKPTQEEDMDCFENVKVTWNPFCTTDVFNRPQLQRTNTC